MKKSRIIVPAMALIAFTSLASIAGSVAWFTASRQVTIDAGTYTVVKTTTSLQSDLSAGVATALSTDQSSKKVITLDNNLLTDGSFDHGDGAFYYPNEVGDAFAEECYKPSATPAVDGILITDANLASKLKRTDRPGAAYTGKGIYTAAIFNIKFTISFGGSGGDFGLYLNRDNTNSNTNYSKFEVTGTPYTAKGFRMAFYPDGAEDANGNDITSSGGHVQNKVIFAGLQQETETLNPGTQSETTRTNIKYVSSGADTLAGKTYTSSDKMIDKNYFAALPDKSVARATATGRKDCLGVFKFTESSKVSLKFKVVAWFEGTDPEIVNRDTKEEYQSVKSTLVFDAVEIANS